MLAIGAKSDFIESIKRTTKQVEEAYERAKCINKFIDCEF
jgi:hypothetical protein